nr:zinc finger, CCHC-type [Tanacetum cinerariifolium]
MLNEDVVDHIAKVLIMLDLINLPGMDSHQLRMKVFPLSLTDDARQWWIDDGEGKITTWEELVEKFFCKFYPESYDGEEKMLDEGNIWGIDPLEFILRVNSSFEDHMKVDERTKKVLFHAWMNGEKNNIGDEQGQTKCKCSNRSNSNNKQPNKRMAANQTIDYSIRSILNKEKLNGSNFLDWYHNLRIVLRNEQKLHHLGEALPEAHPATANVAVRNAYSHRVAEKQELDCLMLAKQKLFETIKAFHACKQEEGQSVSTYVLKMKPYLDQMEQLGYPMPLVLGVNLILTSLSKDYD